MSFHSLTGKPNFNISISNFRLVFCASIKQFHRDASGLQISDSVPLTPTSVFREDVDIVLVIVDDTISSVPWDGIGNREKLQIPIMHKLLSPTFGFQPSEFVLVIIVPRQIGG